MIWIRVDERSGALREVFYCSESVTIRNIVEKSRIVTDQLILAAWLDRLVTQGHCVSLILVNRASATYSHLYQSAPTRPGPRRRNV